MGRPREYIKQTAKYDVESRLLNYISKSKSNQMLNHRPGVLNEDNSKITLSTGIEKNCFVSGNPQDIAGSLRATSETEIAFNPYTCSTQITGGTVNPFLLVGIASGSPVSLEIIDAAKNVYTNVPLPGSLSSIPTASLSYSNWGYDFTPSKKHLAVWFYSNTSEVGTKLISAITGYWIFYPNFRLLVDPDTLDVTFSSDTPIQGSANLSNILDAPPDPDAIVWNDSQSVTSLTGGGTLNFTLEDDPSYITENSVVGVSYDAFPNSGNSYDAANTPHDITAVIYDYVDGEGSIQPALDFIGTIQVIKEARVHKRYTQVATVAADAHTPSVEFTYGSLGSPTFWGDASRLDGSTINLINQSQPYPDVSTTPGDIAYNFTGTPAGFNQTINVWGVGTQVYSGPSHQHTYLDVVNGGVNSSTSVIYTKFGTPLGVTKTASTTYQTTLPNYSGVNTSYTEVSGPVSVSFLVNNRVYKSNRSACYVTFNYNTQNSSSATYVGPTIKTTDGTTTSDGGTNLNVESGFHSSSTNANVRLRAAEDTVAINGSISAGDVYIENSFTSTGGTNIQPRLDDGETIIYTDSFIYDANTSPFDDQSRVTAVNSRVVISYTDTTINTVPAWKFKRWSYNPTTGAFGGKSKAFVIPTRILQLFPFFPTFDKFMVY
jgi:hypothetical protein